MRWSVIAAALALSSPALAARAKITDVCTGCIAAVPEGDEPAPLLVVLHGDWGQMAPELFTTWERFAGPRNVALLSLACPASEGCKGSWWKWNGDPAWITTQVDTLAGKRAIDRSRIWLAGWSGGASYIGLRTQELEKTFSAIVIHGGGIRPMNSGCAPEKAPIVFLVGDKNPLHGLALGLRAHYEECGNAISFLLVPGGEHTAEWKALDARGPEIMDQLAKSKRVAPPPTPPPSSPPPVVSAPPPPPSPPPPRAGCGCGLMPASAGDGALAFLVLLAITRCRGGAPRSPRTSCDGAPSSPRSR